MAKNEKEGGKDVSSKKDGKPVGMKKGGKVPAFMDKDKDGMKKGGRVKKRGGGKACE